MLGGLSMFTKDEVLLSRISYFIYSFCIHTIHTQFWWSFCDVFLVLLMWFSWISCSEWFRLVPDAGSEPIRWLLMLVPRFFPGASAYFKVVVWWIFAFYSCVPWVHGVFRGDWRWTCRWTLVGCFCWFSLLRSCVLKAGFFFNRSVHNFRSTFGIYWSFSMDFVPGTRNIHFKKTLVSVGWWTKPLYDWEMVGWKSPNIHEQKAVV